MAGFGTGLGGPSILQSALRAGQPEDIRVASATSSAAAQLGSSIGAALLNTIAATAAAGYRAGRASTTGAARVAEVATSVYRYSVAMARAWPSCSLRAVPILVLIDASRSTSRRRDLYLT